MGVKEQNICSLLQHLCSHLICVSIVYRDSVNEILMLLWVRVRIKKGLKKISMLCYGSTDLFLVSTISGCLEFSLLLNISSTAP